MHCFLLLLIDLGLVAMSTALALLLRDNLEASPDRILQIVPYLLVTISAAVPVLLISNLNRAVWRFSGLVDYLRVTVAVMVTVLVAVAAGFVLNRLDGVARSLPIIQGLLMACALVGVRVAMRLRHAMRNRDPMPVASLNGLSEAILVIGVNSIAELFLRCIAEDSRKRVNVAGLLSRADRHRGRVVRSYPVLGVPEELEKVLDELGVHGISIDRIVITMKFDELSAAVQEALLKVEQTSSIRLDWLSERIVLCDADSGPKPGDNPYACSGTGGGTSLALDLEALASRPYLRWKRVLDAAAAVVLAVCLAPVMLLVGLVALLDVGYPAIFWQQRPGVLGRPIRVLKFRTMGPARDRHGRHLADAERLSIVGRLLRRTRLDELPQVYNVLIGQMSLVGPRPLLSAEHSSSFVERLGMRPGLTGWAQIKGGRRLAVSDKAALDIWYIKNASFRLDVEIILGTVRTLLFGECVDRAAIRQAWRELGWDQLADLGGALQQRPAGGPGDIG
jgi:lipopolysaccharide/colanic/teichoic acid biosynthesis glycosyltransferase